MLCCRFCSNFVLISSLLIPYFAANYRKNMHLIQIQFLEYIFTVRTLHVTFYRLYYSFHCVLYSYLVRTITVFSQAQQVSSVTQLQVSAETSYIQVVK